MKGHDVSRAANQDSALKGHDVSRAANQNSALKGHDFSRAAKGQEEKGALAPEGSPLPLTTLEAVILVKPQFEAGREFVGKGGIVRDPAGHQVAIDRVRACVEELGGSQIDVIDSPITGAEGNREFLLHAVWP